MAWWQGLAAPLFILCLALVYLARYLRDPIRSIPGPFWAKLSGAWIILLDLSGNRSTTIHDLHLRHGAVVRIAPNQLSFSSTRALKDIYGANSKYTKAEIYESLGQKGIFTTRDRDEYRVAKKRVVPSFSQASIAQMEDMIHRHVANLVKCFDKRVNISLDVLPWFRMFALSVVGEGFAGKSFGGLETEKTPQLLLDLDAVFPSLWVWWMFPTTSKILQYAPFKAVRDFLRAGDDFNQYCGDAFYEYLRHVDPAGRHDLIAKMLNERKELKGNASDIPRALTDKGIIDEVTNLVFAGTDSTGNTLSYLFYELSKQPKWQLRLREELKDVPIPHKYNVVAELPVLEAVVQEILRLRPAAPASLQRITPDTGGLIDDVVVPAGTIVSCQALTIQRNPLIFPDPDTFNPQRWLDAEGSEQLETMRNHITVFGKGARACLGRSLATMEIKLATAALITRYNVEIGSATTHKDMEMACHFVLVPKGKQCVLKFIPIS
ncbi:uncharacterized protein Z520_01803 [Fonsecaea multimorphosa CBS 102226]|uniref:Uncharacterized protein n=1 Tax=Fonsecaea multimorphosa CBS 102226 TaxID=1442371 RepID=A0A0D2HIB9_9EURO|nr:uncharacterized protein Z520_01803 [Fonsecaea multimorphosa CBS 102226]KIY01666.1 hypothetical protein Z520_01803 [Fonsecaea multimorphosa CBS 102226]OAL29861.1 hypothetical protein AYO22_01767 [Fonsecaea multimorphosa]